LKASGCIIEEQVIFRRPAIRWRLGSASDSYCELRENVVVRITWFWGFGEFDGEAQIIKSSNFLLQPLDVILALS
jgi:hypothetical protein